MTPLDDEDHPSPLESQSCHDDVTDHPRQLPTRLQILTTITRLWRSRVVDMVSKPAKGNWVRMWIIPSSEEIRGDFR